MFSLLRNDIENPSYKRGLALTSAMLFFYGLAFQIHAVEFLAPDILEYAFWAALGLAIITSFRAMAERRVLSEARETYVSMIDPAVLTPKWKAIAIGATVMNCALIYGLFFRDHPTPVPKSLAAGLPLVLFVLSAAYMSAARGWVDDTH